MMRLVIILKRKVIGLGILHGCLKNIILVMIEHIGQIQVYMNYIDRNLKKITHDKTIGIIICRKNNEYVIE